MTNTSSSDTPALAASRMTQGLDATTIGPIFTYIGVLSFTMRSLLLGPIVDRLGEPRTMRLGTVLLALGLVGAQLLAQTPPAAPQASLPRKSEVASVHEQVVEHGQIGIQVVVLRDDAEAPLDRAGVAVLVAGVAVLAIVAAFVFLRLRSGDDAGRFDTPCENLHGGSSNGAYDSYRFITATANPGILIAITTT